VPFANGWAGWMPGRRSSDLLDVSKRSLEAGVKGEKDLNGFLTRASPATGAHRVTVERHGPGDIPLSSLSACGGEQYAARAHPLGRRRLGVLTLAHAHVRARRAHTHTHTQRLPCGLALVLQAALPPCCAAAYTLQMERSSLW